MMTNGGKIVCIIPARMESTRLPGKPLALLDTEPMLAHVYRACSCASIFDEIYVATPDAAIVHYCSTHNINYILTGKDCKTGTDRVAEALISCMGKIEYVVSIQADMPFLDQQDIFRFVDDAIFSGYGITSAYSKNLPGDSDVGIILSENKLQLTREKSDEVVGTTLGMYCFKPDELVEFISYDQTENEKEEGIELLRWLDNGRLLKFVESQANSLSVDTTEDLEKARSILEKRSLK